MSDTQNFATVIVREKLSFSRTLTARQAYHFICPRICQSVNFADARYHSCGGMRKIYRKNRAVLHLETRSITT